MSDEMKNETQMEPKEDSEQKKSEEKPQNRMQKIIACAILVVIIIIILLLLRNCNGCGKKAGDAGNGDVVSSKTAQKIRNLLM